MLKIGTFYILFGKFWKFISYFLINKTQLDVKEGEKFLDLILLNIKIPKPIKLKGSIIFKGESKKGAIGL